MLGASALTRDRLSEETRNVLRRHAGSLTSCMMGAQSYLAQWEQSHPALQVRRWKCEWPGREKEEI